MTTLRTIRSWVQGVSRILGIAAAACVMVMMLVMSLEVFQRTTGQGSLPWSYGLIQLLVVMTVFLAAGYGEQAGEHIRVGFIADMLPARVRVVARALGNLITAGLCALLVWATARVAAESLASGEYQLGVVHFPLWPARVVLVVGLTLLTIEMLFRTIDSTNAMFTALGSRSSEAPTPLRSDA